ncbi:hypothetical protein GCM10010168_04330 [Actinoplanes ianthinogenes]|uniref:Uncharacterized protein n=1 Tax=Actinoplanes ianthinogenes TaxID=122358 RepID=A0ABM7LUB5_9ACTN|nr:hypothetical protein [Actinoplanes ianthinogenes]BCJ42827.1 hypothetical protein Aiant_34840 [Actinoplanes ianthinogenes]GGQ91947.1 hypothetical protein GCM10010168_04330 [Actinoplanes ianthinogenes]
MIRRDVLTNHPDGSRWGRKPEGRIELDPADHEEPTWEVREPRRRRFDRRSQTILGLAAIAAMLANAGAAWAYWRLTEPEPVAAPAPAPIDMVLPGRNDLGQILRPGEDGNLLVTVTNDRNVPIRITSIGVGPGNVIADPEHRDAGCVEPRVRVNQMSYPVSWEVAKNTVGAFTLPRALSMDHDTARACVGANFTVPLRARGTER